MLRSRWLHSRSRLFPALRVAYREMFRFARFRARLASALAAPLFFLPTVRFVLRLISLDRRLTHDDLPQAMDWVLRRYYSGVLLGRGIDQPRGPVLYVGNHPGLGDLPSAAVIIDRDDLFFVAKRRELMQDMRGILARCILIDESLASRAAAIGAMLDTFRNGGAVVAYPAGRIEPDPALLADAGAGDMLRDWPPVVDLLIRRANRAGLCVPVVPVYTEAVHAVPPHLRFLTSSAVSNVAREGRAALLTMMTRRGQNRVVRVAFGSPIPSWEYGTADRGSTAITEKVRSELRALHDALRSKP